MTKKNLSGSIAALVTPMSSNGELDLESFKKLIHWHVQAGTDGLIINGTTGESATLTEAEKIKLLELAITTAAGKITIIAGTGTNSTQSTITTTQTAIDLGVDGCMLVTPYYNRPTQEGLYQHFKTVAAVCKEIPLLLYNVPKRTACDLLPETVIKLAKIENIVGIKEATGNVTRVPVLRSGCRQDFILLSGDDATNLEFLQAGGDGVISVVANILPKSIKELCCLMVGRDPQAELKAAQLNKKLDKLYQALALEVNPIPVKWALAYMGLINDGIRLPLTKLETKYHQIMQEALMECKVC